MRGGDFKINLRELGYIIGLLHGDGYLYHDKKQRHYNIEFYLHSEKDKDIQTYLIHLLKKLELKPLIFKDKRFKCVRIRCRSKIFYTLFKKLKKKIISHKNFKLGFISGLIDAEGDIISKKWVRISNTNKNLINKVKRILKNLNINYRVKKIKQKQKNWSVVYRIYVPIEKLINMKSNSIKIRRALGIAG